MTMERYPLDASPNSGDSVVHKPACQPPRWLVVWLPWILFSHILGNIGNVIIPIDLLIFFRGVQTTTFGIVSPLRCWFSTIFDQLWPSRTRSSHTRWFVKSFLLLNKRSPFLSVLNFLYLSVYVTIFTTEIYSQSKNHHVAGTSTPMFHHFSEVFMDFTTKNRRSLAASGAGNWGFFHFA